MDIQLSLPPDQQSELERHAAAAGIDPIQFVLTALQEKLAEPEEAQRETLSYEQWSLRFQNWIGQQRFRNPLFDDSRESIYP